MPIFVFPNKLASAAEQVPLDVFDRDAWEELLSPQNVRVAESEGCVSDFEITSFKGDAFVLSALEFPEDAKSRREVYAQRSWGLILDVDDKVVLSLPELQERLAGTFFVAFSSFSSTVETPRWRVVVPFATPAPVSYARSIWDRINESAFDGLLSKSTRDPTRLGFVGRVGRLRNMAAYTWHMQEGQPLDWVSLRDNGLLVETVPNLDQLDVKLPQERKPYWISSEDAFKEALAYYLPQAEGVGPGGRHKKLFETSCALWWGWAAEDEHFVYRILSALNDSFDEPKDTKDIAPEVTAGYRRTIEGLGPPQAVDYGHWREPPTPFSIDGVRALAHTLMSRSKQTRDDTYRARLSLVAGMLRQAIEGQALCGSENIHELQYLYKHLAEGFSRNPVSALANFLEPSLAIMRTRHPMEARSLDPALVRARILRAQQAFLLLREHKAEEKEEEMRDALRDLFQSDRDWPYTKAELSEWEITNGLTMKTWILVSGSEYYVFFNGTYIGPRKEKELEIMVHRYALPMPGLDTYVRNERGQLKPKPVVAIAQEYGLVVDRVEYNYNSEHTRVQVRGEGNQKERVLTVAAGRRVHMSSKFSQDIDTWIRYLSGSKYELFLNYLAAFPQTGYAVPCLYLYGTTGTGKSSFVKGLSRLYRRGEPLSYESATAKFNVGLLDTPVILCDERIPEVVKKSGQTTAIFRDYIQRTDHVVETKYGSSNVLKGAIRMVIAANNLNVLTDDRELLSNLDVDGTVNRFLLLEVRPETKGFLESMPADRFKEILDYDLARHVLWLSENRELDTSKRFMGIEDTDKLQLTSSIVTSKEVPNLMCELVVSAILHPKVVAGVRYDADGVYIRKELWGLKNTWEGLGLEMPRFPVGKMARGVALIARERKAFWETKGGSGRTVHYRAVDVDALVQWLRDSEYVAMEEFEEALLKHMQEAAVLEGTNANVNGPTEKQ